MTRHELIHVSRFLDQGTTRATVVSALSWGFLFTLGQILFACVVGSYQDGSLSVRPTVLARSYQRLINFDSQWYLCIVVEGYDAEREFQTGKRGNVAFFPGYPLLVRGVAAATGLSRGLSLLIVSQLACWGFWVYFFLLFERHDVPPVTARLLAFLVAAQPGAFFLIAGYAESLFLFALLGYIYWTDSESVSLKWLGAFHGILMTATRIVGVPLVIIPVIRSLAASSNVDRFGRTFNALILAATASLGGIGFFAYCQHAFGAWDLYMTTQELGWGLKPDYFALVKSDTYLFGADHWQIDGFLSPDWLSRVLVPTFVVLFGLAIALEIYAKTTRPNSSVAERLGYLVSAGLLFLVMTAGLYNNEYRSVLRYLVGCVVLLCLEVGHYLANEDIECPNLVLLISWLIVTFTGALVQAVYLHRFLNGLWVA